MDTVTINITEEAQQVDINIIETVDQVDINVNEVLGRNGLSAYEIAVQDGYVGTESQWLLSLKGTSGGNYTHFQNIPASVWNVNHSLGYRPAGIVVKDSAGTQWFGDIDYVDVNNLTISFGLASFSGEAYIS